MDNVNTRWVKQPVWFTPITPKRDYDSFLIPTQLRPSSRNHSPSHLPQVEKIREQVRNHLQNGEMRKFAQKVLMLKAAGMTVSKELLDSCNDLIEKISEKDVHKMNAVAKTWARRIQSVASL